MTKSRPSTATDRATMVCGNAIIEPNKCEGHPGFLSKQSAIAFARFDG
jgi:hypothetical protein